MAENKSAWVHPTALVEDGVTLGDGTRIWDGVHIRHGAKIGKNCIVGEKTYVAYDVSIGDHVKINANVYICAGVTVQDFCMISAHTVFTNDLYPRAGNINLDGLEVSEPTEDTLETVVCKGTTIGANVTIGPGLTLGEFCMVGMGSVVTRNVEPYQLVKGVPARGAGWVCACGLPLVREEHLQTIASQDEIRCTRCHRRYRWSQERLSPIVHVQ